MKYKEDRRVAMTKHFLKDALIELLKNKSIYRISIRELCDLADVNRTTFYKYYSSQFDLLTDMENDIIEFIKKTVIKNEANTEIIIISLCNYLENNLEFARLIINNNIDPIFPQKLFSLETIKNSVLKNLSEDYDVSDVEYLYNFVTYGAFRIICIWLNKEERETPEKLAMLIKQMGM
ncbi:MAG: TetR family transcriptional regulator C-terminal domain-containing protein [Eubacterium sp.]|nr:TetR family transcriptional regulator C-terminal domain-containing protein [Eubacterium sp.]